MQNQPISGLLLAAAGGQVGHPLIESSPPPQHASQRTPSYPHRGGVALWKVNFVTPVVIGDYCLTSVISCWRRLRHKILASVVSQRDFAQMTCLNTCSKWVARSATASDWSGWRWIWRSNASGKERIVAVSGSTSNTATHVSEEASDASQAPLLATGSVWGRLRCRGRGAELILDVQRRLLAHARPLVHLHQDRGLAPDENSSILSTSPRLVDAYIAIVKEHTRRSWPASRTFKNGRTLRSTFHPRVNSPKI